MFLPSIKDAYRNRLKAGRWGISSFRERYQRFATQVKLVRIPVDACLLGGDNGISGASYARMTDDIRRASRPICEWPHVKLLRQFDNIGELIWAREVFERTDYYRNAVLCIELCGKYFDAVTPDQVLLGACRFVDCYRGLDKAPPRQEGQSDENSIINNNRYVTVHQVKGSNYYQVIDGHHRLAIAYMKGVREVKALIVPPAVMTPVQELLLDVQHYWRDAQRELYQPIDSPEVAEWVLVRRCSDRLEKMKEFLRKEGLTPPTTRSYLDVASSYGWFVSRMSEVGFWAEGVERDPMAISVGKIMYGLKPERVHRADAIGFLSSLQDRYDVISCFGLAHDYILNHLNATAEELLHLLDSATRRVMFFDMGQCHEDSFSSGPLAGWDPDYIQRWLDANTTFTRIVQLGTDEDGAPSNRGADGRMLFACLR